MGNPQTVQDVSLSSSPLTECLSLSYVYSILTPDALHASYDICSGSQCGTIDDLYVDGLSITYTNNTRVHIWTFVVDHPHGSSRCPCGSILAFQVHHLLAMTTTVRWLKI